MRAGTKLDILLPVLDPVRHRHKRRNSKIAGDVEHPKPAPVAGQLALQIADVGIVELSQAQLSQTEAEIAYASARYAYQTAIAEMRFQTGQ